MKLHLVRRKIVDSLIITDQPNKKQTLFYRRVQLKGEANGRIGLCGHLGQVMSNLSTLVQLVQYVQLVQHVH